MRLTKHHGLGNDFLVVPTDQRLARRAWEAVAVELCDRRRGIGADGLLVLTPTPDDATTDVRMAVYNADGSRAEMSGNGIRCLAQAELLRRDEAPGPTTLCIGTDAGTRAVTVAPGTSTTTVEVTVAMGPVEEIPEPEGWAAVGCDPMRPVVHLSLGNPHTVVGVEELAGVDLGTIGAAVPTVNLEIVTAGRRHDEIAMRVHERGAGITEACGTGAVAAATAAVRWGLAAPHPNTGEITVHMDGGDVRVRVPADPDGSATLVGPATYIAALEVTP